MKLLATDPDLELVLHDGHNGDVAQLVEEIRDDALRSSDIALEIKHLVSKTALHMLPGVRLVAASEMSLEAILQSLSNLSGSVREVVTSVNQKAALLNDCQKKNDRSNGEQRDALLFQKAIFGAVRLVTEIGRLARLLSGLIAAVETTMDARSARLDPDANSPKETWSPIVDEACRLAQAI